MASYGLLFNQINQKKENGLLLVQEKKQPEPYPNKRKTTDGTVTQEKMRKRGAK